MITHLDVEVPRVVLVVGDVYPGVVSDDPLVKGEYGLVARLDPPHLNHHQPPAVNRQFQRV